MQCHYCDREAALGAEKDGVTVGLCAAHFRKRLDELTSSAELKAIHEQIDIDSVE